VSIGPRCQTQEIHVILCKFYGPYRIIMSSTFKSYLISKVRSGVENDQAVIRVCYYRHIACVVRGNTRWATWIGLFYKSFLLKTLVKSLVAVDSIIIVSEDRLFLFVIFIF
jgi:hypothetical protein